MLLTQGLPVVETRFKHGGTKPSASQELSESDPDSEETTLVSTLAELHVKNKSHQGTAQKSSRKQYDPDRCVGHCFRHFTSGHTFIPLVITLNQ